MISNGNRIEWSPIRSVIIRVITKSEDRASTAVGALMNVTLTDFTLSYARRFYSSMGNRLAVKGLTTSTMMSQLSTLLFLVSFCFQSLSFSSPPTFRIRRHTEAKNRKKRQRTSAKRRQSIITANSNSVDNRRLNR